MSLSLFNEALTFKEMAKRALMRGEIEKARRYLIISLRNLERLETESPDSIMKEIWRKIRKDVDDMLRNLETYAQQYSMQATETRKKQIFIRERKQAKDARREMKSITKKETGRTDVPECEGDFMMTEIPEIDFSDVAGFEDVKRELRESIEWQLKYPELLSKLKLKPLKGILLYGPPGTGKTYIVRAAAGEFKLPLIVADPATLMSKYVGESEKMVKAIFSCARRLAPSIIFVDEIDKVLPLKTFSSDAPKRVESQFLQELDGVRSSHGFMIIFATNEPWNISPSLMRPGRVDRIIYVGPPEKIVRRELFEIHLRGVPLGDDVNFDELAELTEPNEEGYYSASGIAQICNEAKKMLMRRWTRGNKSPLKRKELIKAIELVPRSISHRMIKQYESWGLKYSSF